MSRLSEYLQRLTLGDLGLLLAAAAAWTAHVLWADVMPWPTLFALLGGTVLGLTVARHRVPIQLGRNARNTALIAQDIQTLQQAFGVLHKQVDATIDSSQEAVMSMMARMNRVHHNTDDLRRRILSAVERSSALSSDSLSRAGQHRDAVDALAEHQRQFEAAQSGYETRVRAVADQVRQLTPLAALITDISRQTNLLAINASIEAARAGREGAGFKVVAAEVRRLSAQTEQAAHQISDGISLAATRFDEELGHLMAEGGQRSSDQLGEIAAHIQVMSDTLGDVVPYLAQLSGDMEVGMASVTEDIINTLGDMQFQDVNRQLLEQINGALDSLSAHFAQIYQLIDGDAPPPPMVLEDLLARWTSNYVMHAQRMAHVQALQGQDAPAINGPARGPAPPAPELALASADGPRIELF